MHPVGKVSTNMRIVQSCRLMKNLFFGLAEFGSYIILCTFANRMNRKTLISKSLARGRSRLSAWCFVGVGMVALLWAGCSHRAAYELLGVAGFQSRIEASSRRVQLVDVRTPVEFAEGHIAGSINLNVQDSAFRQKARAALSRRQPVALYCRSGKRSHHAASLLTEMGYEVIELQGGVLAWQEAGLALQR